MDSKIDVGTPSYSDSSSLMLKAEEAVASSDIAQAAKETVTIDDTSNVTEKHKVELIQQKSEVAVSSQSSEVLNETSMELCKKNLVGDSNENNLPEETLKAVQSCLSSVICNVEAGVLPVVDSKADYITRRNFSEDSEEDSDSWDEDEDSDSSTSSNSSSSDSSSSSSSSTISSSSLASGEDSDFDIFSNKESNNKGPPRTKGELSLDDLPPIENLHITVPSGECMEIGKITSIVEQLVVIQAYKDTPALDLDSVLFLNEGEQMLGHVFDVFGPVKEPCYCVRFNSPQHVNEHGVKVGMKVYCAPNLQEHSHFVFLSELLRQKGCDASWEHNNEPPPNVVEYSDDEEERKARRHAKMQRKQGKSEPEEELNKKHQTYEQRMNARNLRMSERHWNRSNNGGEVKSASTSQASVPHSQMQKRAQFQGRIEGAHPGIPSNFRPWGQGPGQVRQQSGPWQNNPPHHASGPQPPNTQLGPSGFIRPPAFNMPRYMQSPPAPHVQFPTTLLQSSQNRQPVFDTSVPPPPLSHSPCSVDRAIQLFPEQSCVGQQVDLIRSGSVPQSLHLSGVGSLHQAGSQVQCTPPPLYRSESMPSVLPTLQSPNFFVRPDTTKPPPFMSSIMSHQFGSTTFGNPVAFSNIPPCPARPTYPNPPPAMSPLLLPPPPPPPAPPQSEAASWHPPHQVQQNRTGYP